MSQWVSRVRWITLMLGVVAIFMCQIAYSQPLKVDMKQAKVEETFVSAPSNQGTAVLTLDKNLQKDVQTLLQRSRAPEAAAVLIDVRSGHVLAWASIDGQDRDLVAQPYAPPASLFKVVTAASLMENAGVSDHARQCYVGGKRSVELKNLRSSGANGANCNTLATAIGFSQNMVIAGLAVRYLNSQQVQNMSQKMGFNGSVPIDIVVQSGTSSVPATKEGLARAAAGFGPGTLTPLEAAYMMTVVANNGTRRRIRLVRHVIDSNGKRITPVASSQRTSRAISTLTAKRLQKLLQVTTSKGTAAKAFRDQNGKRFLGKHAGGGKTGTLARGQPQRLFTWYAGYAPANDPQVAVAVLVANESKWWRKGAEVARDVLRSYFARHHVAGISHPINRTVAQTTLPKIQPNSQYKSTRKTTAKQKN